MKCDEHQIIISAYLDDEASPGESAGIFVHLAVCEECRLFLRTLTEIKLRAAREGGYEAPPAAEALAMSGDYGIAAPGKRPGLLTRFFRGRLSLPVPIAAVLAAVVIIGGMLLTRPEPHKTAAQAVASAGSAKTMSLPVIRIGGIENNKR